ncbi:MAG: DUF3617 family protein [Novosphingobium sp.]
MKVHHSCLALALISALSACSGSDDAPVVQSSEAAFDGLTEGQWDVRSHLATMDQAEMETLGEDRAAELMRDEKSAEHCLGFSQRTQPPVGMFYPTSETCTFVEFSMGKGLMRGKISCPSTGAEPMRMSGHYDAKSFSVTITQRGEGEFGQDSERSYATNGKLKDTC